MFLVPLGVGEQLATWGIAADRVIELDWWDSHALGRLTLTATPAQHFSGRGLTDRNKTLWASWVAAGRAGAVFFSEFGYGPHYRAIGEALGPFDLTFIENGAYSTNWPFVHHFPEQAVQAHRDLQGRLMVPVLGHVRAWSAPVGGAGAACRSRSRPAWCRPAGTADRAIADDRWRAPPRSLVGQARPDTLNQGLLRR